MMNEHICFNIQELHPHTLDTHKLDTHNNGFDLDNILITL